MASTQALLADYVRNRSDRAFHQLVNSYLGFVYSTALRILQGNRQLAEDVSQTVFVDLALKASGLPSDVSLGGWLHRHTCFLARKAFRRELRLKARERRAIELHLIDDCTQENLGEVSAVLDEAVNDLGTEDRTAVLLRFFEQRDFQAVGKALGKSEDAARMRVARALEKLGLLLKRRGITSSAAALGFVLETKAVALVSAGLTASISKGAIASAVKGRTAFALIKEACPATTSCSNQHSCVPGTDSRASAFGGSYGADRPGARARAREPAKNRAGKSHASGSARAYVSDR